MLIELKEYKNILHNFYFIDCVVRNRNVFSFVADSWYDDDKIDEEEKNGSDPNFRDKRIISFVRHFDSGKQWGLTDCLGWGSITGGAAKFPKNQFIGIEKERKTVYVLGSGDAYEDAALTPDLPDTPVRGGISRIKTIGGYAYVCGGNRSVGKRLEKGKWFTHNNQIPPDYDNYLHTGFEDIDGFNENDLYAVGGKGDVWHFDGSVWRQISFPANIPLNTVCCAADGNVYISGYQGKTFIGRGDNWEKIDEGNLTKSWKDMVWHEDRVWCTNDNGLWAIHNDKVEVVQVPAEIFVCAGNLYANDGVLLMAGLEGAAFHEKGEWHSIVLRRDMEFLLEQQAKP